MTSIYKFRKKIVFEVLAGPPLVLIANVNCVRIIIKYNNSQFKSERINIVSWSVNYKAKLHGMWMISLTKLNWCKMKSVFSVFVVWGFGGIGTCFCVVLSFECW